MGKGLFIMEKGLMKIFGFRCLLQISTFNVLLLVSILSGILTPGAKGKEDNLFIYT